MVGPDLSNAGRLDAAVIRQKITVAQHAGPAAGRPRRRAGHHRREDRDGKEIRGVRRNEDTFSLQMVDATGQLHLLDKMALASVAVENRLADAGDYAHALDRGGDRQTSSRTCARSRPATRRRLAAQPMAPGGLTYDRLVKSQRRAGQLADVLGRLPGHALLAR